MTNLELVNEAIISIKDGTLDIIIGKNLNKVNSNYHNRVSFEMQSSGNEILVKGHKMQDIYFSGICSTDENKDFEFYRENIVGFEERVEKKKVLKFSWRKFIYFKEISFVDFYKYKINFLPYKDSLWKPKEYRANNWVITELKS